MKLYGLIIISLFIFQMLPGQSFPETLKYADEQYVSGDLDNASKAYQRALFFSEGEENLHIFRQLANIAFLKKDYNTAREYFGLAINQAGNDSLKTALLFEKATCYILGRDYQFALIDLLSVNPEDEHTGKRLDFYMGLCYFGMEDFDNAKSHFRLCTDSADSVKFEALFSHKRLWSPSPKKARIFSTIIPGSGQVYAGDIKAGMNSLLLTAGLVALGINISVKYKLIDAIATVLPWYQRYYMGGVGKAEEIAINKRRSKRNDSYVAVIKLIEESGKYQH